MLNILNLLRLSILNLLLRLSILNLLLRLSILNLLWLCILNLYRLLLLTDNSYVLYLICSGLNHTNNLTGLYRLT